MKKKFLLKFIFSFFLIMISITLFIDPVLKNHRRDFQKGQVEKYLEKKIEVYEKKTIEKKISMIQSIFIPSWVIREKINENLKGFCPLIYFGQKREIDDFFFFVESNLECHQRYFTLRIENIKEREEWSYELEDLSQFLKEKQFNGWVLDLEISGFLSSDSQQKINQMVEIFYQQGRKANFKSYIAIYGDFFYRKRGYNLPFFVKNSDGIMIMAYDFSKSYGLPGPNFPFAGREKYGYDFQMMIDDFLQFVPKEKLSVIFGMFGYHWQVDEKERPLNQAKPLTLNQIKEKFLSSSMPDSDNGRGKNIAKEFTCRIDNCIVRRDQMAKEVEINYTLSSEKPDEDGIYRIDYHIVWFEDEESVKIKTDYLKEKGINQIGFWAITYF